MQINKNNIRKNRKWVDHDYKIGYKFRINIHAAYKYETPYKGPFLIKRWCNNVTVTLQCGTISIRYIICLIKPYVVRVSWASYNYKLKLLYRRSYLSLDLFHIEVLIISFLIHDPSPHPIGGWSSTSFFLMSFIYKKSFLFRGSTSSAYSCILLSLSDVLLKTIKTYQPCNP